MPNYYIKGFFGTDAAKAAAKVPLYDFWVNAATLPSGSMTIERKINDGHADPMDWVEGTFTMQPRSAWISLETNEIYIYIAGTPYLLGTEPDANYETAWDEDGERWYHTGVSKGFLCVHGENPTNDMPALSGGVKEYGETILHGSVRHPWSGLISVNVSPEGGEQTPIYADDQKYLNLMSQEECKFTIEAYQSPEAFDACDGTLNILNGLGFYEQPRKKFDFGFFTQLRNDKGEDTIKIGTSIVPLGQLHIFYNCVAAPSDRQFQTMNDSPEAMTLSWDVTAAPVHFSYTAKQSVIKPCDVHASHIIIDTRRLASAENSTVAARTLQAVNKIWNDSTTRTYLWNHMPGILFAQLIPYTAPAPQPNPTPNP